MDTYSHNKLNPTEGLSTAQCGQARVAAGSAPMTQTQHRDNAHVHSVPITQPATHTHASVSRLPYYSPLISATHFLHIYLSVGSDQERTGLGHNVAICVPSNMTVWLIRHDSLCSVNRPSHKAGVLLNRESWGTNYVTSCLQLSLACS